MIFITPRTSKNAVLRTNILLTLTLHLLGGAVAVDMVEAEAEDTTPSGVIPTTALARR